MINTISKPKNIEKELKVEVTYSKNEIFQSTKDVYEYINSHHEAFIDLFIRLLSDLEIKDQVVSDYFEKLSAGHKEDPDFENLRNTYLVYLAYQTNLKKTINQLDYDTLNGEAIYQTLFKILSPFKILNDLYNKAVEKKSPDCNISISSKNLEDLGYPFQNGSININNINDLIEHINLLSSKIKTMQPDAISLFDKLKAIDNVDVEQADNGLNYIFIRRDSIPQNFESTLNEEEQILLDLFTSTNLNTEDSTIFEGLLLVVNPHAKALSKESLSSNTEILIDLIKKLHRSLWIDQNVAKQRNKETTKIAKFNDPIVRTRLQKQLKKDGQKLHRSSEQEWEKTNPWIELSEQSQALIETTTQEESNQLKTEIDQVEEIKQPNEKLQSLSQYIESAYDAKNSLDYLNNASFSGSQLEFLNGLLEIIEEFRTEEKLNDKIGYEILYGKLPSNRTFQTKDIMKFGNKILKNAIKININSGDRVVVYWDGGPKIIFLDAAEYHDQRKL